MLEVWKWDLQCTHVYWNILRMVLEHPQKQYRHRMMTYLYHSVFLASRNLLVPFLSLLQTEVHNLGVGGVSPTRKNSQPTVIYQAAWAFTTNYKIKREYLLLLKSLLTLSCIRERGSRTERIQTKAARVWQREKLVLQVRMGVKLVSSELV